MKNETEKYYCVICKCGHVGRSHYIPIAFAIRAVTKKEAAENARQFPRVKHQHKDAVLNVEEITPEEYETLLEANGTDPYLKCKNKQEQRRIPNLSSRMCADPHFISRRQTIVEKKAKRKERLDYLFKKRAINERLDHYLEISASHERSEI